MPRLNAFSWGYFGWGNAADRFVAAVDRAEAARGFKPPLFVDTRLRRSVRAKMFNGSAFEGVVGPRRHRWMNGLGNRRIAEGGGGILIDRPEEAEGLLDLVEGAAEDGRRVIFFCGCEYAMYGKQRGCHRRAVAKLLLRAAAKRGRPLTVAEWPGEKPRLLHWRLSPAEMRAVTSGRLGLSVQGRMKLGELGNLSPFSALEMTCEGERAEALVGRPFYRDGQWQLRLQDQRRLSRSGLAADALSWWRWHGYEPLKGRA